MEYGTGITRSGVICLELCVGLNVPLLESACFAVCPADSVLLYDADRGRFPWLYLICIVLFQAHF